MEAVRIGVIGTGGMGSTHACTIKEKTEGAVLAAVCDANVERAEALSAELGCRPFMDFGAMIDSGTVDAVIVATPHFSHTTIGSRALQAGLHVLVEKPLSVHKADCERLIKARRSRDQVFGTMLVTRTNGLYSTIKAMIDNKELGRLERVNWIVTDWFRTEHYYRSGSWRATWKGEGGGILVNQCPHQLDLLQWLCGMPRSVQAFCRIGQWHAIEVEDDVTAYMVFPNGATGVFVATTGEAPGTNRLEICGDLGKIVVENERILFTKNETSSRTFCRESETPMGSPQTQAVPIEVNVQAWAHHLVVQNFVDAILKGTPLIATGEEGIHSVELANAMLYSTMTGKRVDFPLDGVLYEKMLNELIRTSTHGSAKQQLAATVA
jgi:predicted dehydrogenase